MTCGLGGEKVLNFSWVVGEGGFSKAWSLKTLKFALGFGNCGGLWVGLNI